MAAALAILFIVGIGFTGTMLVVLQRNELQKEIAHGWGQCWFTFASIAYFVGLVAGVIAAQFIWAPDWIAAGIGIAAGCGAYRFVRNWLRPDRDKAVGSDSKGDQRTIDN